MAKISQRAQQAIDAHTAYEEKCSYNTTTSWLESKRIARGMLGKRSLWCGECGESIELSKEIFNELRDKYYDEKVKNIYITCPHCGRKLKIGNIAETHILDTYQELVKIGDYQAIRVWMVEQYLQKGRPASVGVFHVYDQLWDKEGHDYIFSRRVSCCGYNVWNPFKKDEPYLYYRSKSTQWTHGYRITATRIKSLCTWAKQRELHLHHCDMKDYQRIFDGVLKNDAFAETLWKADSPIFREYINLYSKKKETQAAIKVAWKHGWSDWSSIWFDMIANIIELGLDYRNPAYICPKNLRKAHDHFLKLVDKKLQKEQEEKECRAVADAEKIYSETYSKFIRKYLNLCLTANEVEIRPLHDIRAFYEEGKEMKHCVWSNGYYKKPNCLILSARVTGKRVETIEVNTQDWKVVQIYGKCNSQTKYHALITNIMQDWCNQQKVKHA